jgi:hypothetical protein
VVGILSFPRLGNVERKKKILLEELRVFDIIEEEKALGVEEKMRKGRSC